MFIFSKITYCGNRLIRNYYEMIFESDIDIRKLWDQLWGESSNTGSSNIQNERLKFIAISQKPWRCSEKGQLWKTTGIFCSQDHQILEIFSIFRDLPHSTEYCKNMSEIFPIFHCNWNIVAIFLSNIAKYFTAKLQF